MDVKVIIEASSHYEANGIAENIGIYFDGCENGNDCDCCGDRWYAVDDNDAQDTPSIDIDEIYSNYGMNDYVIHYLDGRKEHFKFGKTKDETEKV